MRDLKIYIAIASALLIIFLLAEYNRPSPVDWSASLKNTDKIPFGTYILYNRLHDIFPGSQVQPFREPVYNVINDHDIQHGTYLIISNSVNINEYDFGKLTDFMKRGNDVFIAASDFGGYLEKELKIETDKQLIKANASESVKFVSPSLDTTRLFGFDKPICDDYFSGIDTVKATVLGKNSHYHVTYIKYSYGKGSLYLSVNPLLFTNYSLLQSPGSDFASGALSYLKNDKLVLWDEFYTIGRDGEESLMRVFLRNNALQWAYYLSLFGLLVFVLYEMKRRQRVIPVIEPLRNSSVEFVNVVGQVYYEQRNNANIAQKKAVYFLEHIRAKYHLKTSVLDDEFITTLSQKSGVELEFLQKLINQVAIIKRGAYISDRDLISFNRNIEQFYIQSR